MVFFIAIVSTPPPKKFISLYLATLRHAPAAKPPAERALTRLFRLSPFTIKVDRPLENGV